MKHYFSNALVGALCLSVIGVVLATTHESVISPDQALQETVPLGNSARQSLEITTSGGVTQQQISLATAPLTKPSAITSRAASEQYSANLKEAPLTIKPEWIEYTIQKGDNVSAIFEQQALQSSLNKIIADPETANALAKIIPGKVLKFKKDSEGLKELRYDISATKRLSIKRSNTGDLETNIIEHKVTTRQATASGTINSSLFLAGKEAGISDSLIMELVNIFVYDIDFALDIRQGDSFKLIYDERFANGNKIGDGAIVAAEFTNNGRVVSALRYEDNGKVEYYTPKGGSMRKAFIRTPVKFTRISSGFNPKRKHPILHTIRAHRGVDYAASKGTPIKSTGMGKIEFIGRKNGYGKTIVVKHGKQYSTLYAHLSGFKTKLKAGSRVKQGQVIGYVGSTGSATGPHLHYEFRVNGVHKDPLKVKLPNAPSLGGKQLANFKKETRSALALLTKSKNVAQAN